MKISARKCKGEWDNKKVSKTNNIPQVFEAHNIGLRFAWQQLHQNGWKGMQLENYTAWTLKLGPKLLYSGKFVIQAPPGLKLRLACPRFGFLKPVALVISSRMAIFFFF